MGDRTYDYGQLCMEVEASCGQPKGNLQDVTELDDAPRVHPEGGAAWGNTEVEGLDQFGFWVDVIVEFDRGESIINVLAARTSLKRDGSVNSGNDPVHRLV